MKNNVRPLMNKLGRSILHIVTLLGILSFTVVSTAQALTVTFADPVGDQQGTIDVTGMVMTFTPAGHFQIDLTADSNHPFVGQFRVSINLFNPDVFTLDPADSFFSDVCKNCAVFNPKTNNSDFNLLVPTTTLTLKTGHSKVLTHWAAGDQVAISSFAGLGNPPGTSLFRSAVASLPFTFLTNEDTIGYDNITNDGVTDGVAIIQP